MFTPILQERRIKVVAMSPEVRRKVSEGRRKVAGRPPEGRRKGASEEASEGRRKVARGRQ